MIHAFNLEGAIAWRLDADWREQEFPALEMTLLHPFYAPPAVIEQRDVDRRKLGADGSLLFTSDTLLFRTSDWPPERAVEMLGQLLERLRFASGHVTTPRR